MMVRIHHRSAVSFQDKVAAYGSNICEAWSADSLYDSGCECLKVVRNRFQGHPSPFISGRHEVVLEGFIS